MLEVRIYSDYKSGDLENQINNFLSSAANKIELIDIKFSTHLNSDGDECYTALIMYRKL